MSLRDLLRGTRIVLLDFDGPVCSIFAGYPARVVAQEVREFITRRTGTLPAAAMHTDDPLEVLRATEQTDNPALIRETAAFLREHETIAAATAELTPGLRAVLAAAMRTDRRLIVVSNNSEAAVDAFLARRSLSRAVEGIMARFDSLAAYRR